MNKEVTLNSTEKRLDFKLGRKRFRIGIASDGKPEFGWRAMLEIDKARYDTERLRKAIFGSSCSDESCETSRRKRVGG